MQSPFWGTSRVRRGGEMSATYYRPKEVRVVATLVYIKFARLECMPSRISAPAGARRPEQPGNTFAEQSKEQK